MLTLATLPDDALGTIMHFLDGPALEALSETSRRLRTFTAASRAIWIQALQSVYLARGAAPPDLRVLFSLPTKELRRRTTQSHRALHNFVNIAGL
ncbi:hypothetical protein EXIGLDRAFT_718368 [Exidia glandulosa HHB12029]|uniref:F-box domain-containing protein n=1 Tax=Exidia glandulosa HHB12029 TaxID=1314781 RepID=A0A165HS11_EXIGL|nr:hypothetical protein EXIGLDRAFT_718368 [Exidia glandulosa HHB12029]